MLTGIIFLGSYVRLHVVLLHVGLCSILQWKCITCSSLNRKHSVYRQVKIWFQNRRSKIKKQNKQPDADSSSSSCIVSGADRDTVAGTRDQASPPTMHVGARPYREDDDDDVRRMFRPDLSIVYRQREAQSAATPAHPFSHQVRVASEPEASNVRHTEPDSKMHLMTSSDVDVQPARRHYDLLPTQQLVLPSLQLLSGFHPAAAAASESSLAWPNITAPPPVRDAGQQMSNYGIDAADSSSFMPWYSHHLIDSYNSRWRRLACCTAVDKVTQYQ